MRCLDLLLFPISMIELCVLISLLLFFGGVIGFLDVLYLMLLGKMYTTFSHI